VNKKLLTDKIMEFSATHKDDMVKMINLLMNDLTYLYDEAINKLEAIKMYQDLLDNVSINFSFFIFS